MFNLYSPGTFQIDNIVPQASGESTKVKVKVRVNINGIFSVSSATMTEKIENTSEETEPMDVDVGEKEKKVVENGKDGETTPEADTPQESQMSADQATPDKENSNAEEQSSQVCNRFHLEVTRLLRGK
jgi:heat shock protein 4